MKKTDTPRTDEQVWTAFHHHEMCDVVDKDFARQLEIELAASLENQFKAQAEASALRTMAIELVKELLSKCDDPIHREQLASLSVTNSLQPSA